MRITVLDGLLTFFVLFSFSAAAYAADAAKENPHSAAGDCSICHVAPPEKLRGWFVFGSTKKEMKADLNQLCLQCHTIEPKLEDSMGVGIGHATGKKTAVNHANLPLASDGTITCATTCHDMHISSDDQQLQRKHLRLNPNSLCTSCHDR